METALIVGGYLILFFLMPHNLRNDDRVRLNDIQSLLHGHLTDSKYSLVMPLMSVPVLLLSHVVGSQAYWAVQFNMILVAVGVYIAYRLLRGRVDPRLFRLTVIVLLFASFLTSRLRDYGAEVCTATLVALGIICLVTNQHVLAGWAAIVFGVVNTPAAAIGLVLLAVVWTVRTRQLRHLLPVAVAAVLIMLEAWIRRGGPFETGYGKQGLTFPFVLGLLSVLFSSGRGLIFYTPGLWLWLDRRGWRQQPGRLLVALMLVFTLGLVVVYAKWWAWYGGITWGPRFFTFAAIPASIMLAARIWRAGRSAWADLATLAVLALSAWVALSGALANLVPGVLLYCAEHGFGNLHNCLYTPGSSSLWLSASEFPRISVPTAMVAVFICAVFAYLAAPLAAGVFRLRPARSWAAGWHV